MFRPLLQSTLSKERTEAAVASQAKEKKMGTETGMADAAAFERAEAERLARRAEQKAKRERGFR